MQNTSQTDNKELVSLLKVTLDDNALEFDGENLSEYASDIVARVRLSLRHELLRPEEKNQSLQKEDPFSGELFPRKTPYKTLIY